MIPAYPVPIPEGAPVGIIAVVVVAAAVAGFVVLVWQVVRYFRSSGD